MGIERAFRGKNIVLTVLATILAFYFLGEAIARAIPADALSGWSLFGGGIATLSALYILSGKAGKNTKTFFILGIALLIIGFFI